MKYALASVPVPGNDVELDALNVTAPLAGTPPDKDHPGATTRNESSVSFEAPHVIPDASDAMLAEPAADKLTTTGTVSLPLGTTTDVGDEPS